MDPDTVDIDEFLKEEGFDTPAALECAREALDGEQIAYSRKARMSVAKVERARSLLSSMLAKACCVECEGLLRVPAQPRRLVARVSCRSCQLCHGSNARRAIRALEEGMKKSRFRNLLVIGGTPNQRRELRELQGHTKIELRLVEGAAKVHRQKDAAANLQWAELVAIWCPTELNHKVSNLYSQAHRSGCVKVMVKRRGVESLCREVLEKL